MFRDVDVVHRIDQTRLSRDGGFDFHGVMTLPAPLHYEISFRGEVKRHKASIGPKDVSRLVARLGRGEYGLFVTTSYYTTQAQEEVLQDAYPTRLFAGRDVVNIMRTLGIATSDQIRPDWICSLGTTRTFLDPVN